LAPEPSPRAEPHGNKVGRKDPQFFESESGVRAMLGEPRVHAGRKNPERRPDPPRAAQAETGEEVPKHARPLEAARGVDAVLGIRVGNDEWHSAAPIEGTV
jgi:hypothetical protein